MDLRGVILAGGTGSRLMPLQREAVVPQRRRLQVIRIGLEEELGVSRSGAWEGAIAGSSASLLWGAGQDAGCGPGGGQAGSHLATEVAA